MLGELYAIRWVTYAAFACVLAGVGVGATVVGDGLIAVAAFGATAVSGIAAWEARPKGDAQ